MRRACEQDCGRWAQCYGIDPRAGGWGGYYCLPCLEGLRFTIADKLERELEQEHAEHLERLECFTPGF